MGLADRGYRGVQPPEGTRLLISHTRGLPKALKKLLKRRQAIEPLIGHTKADHRMDRCWLQGAVGDALHALSCAAGYNIRWLMRAILKQAAKVAKVTKEPRKVSVAKRKTAGTSVARRRWAAFSRSLRFASSAVRSLAYSSVVIESSLK